MTTRITDFSLYGHLWGTPETRAIFDEEATLQGWLDVIAALAAAQAAEGVIPAGAARLIAQHARVAEIDLDLAAEQTRATSHSMLGLIRALQAVLPEEAREHVYTGATVQDITDTRTALAIRDCGAIVWRDLRVIEDLLLSLAVAHRDTPMTGRTHGQAGSPVTFGWKAASWADETRRHLDRMREGAPRWLTGQLGGGVGSLVFYGGKGLAVRARFCAELGLADPGISWLSARDRVAEFGQVQALVCGTLARIGGEVYELQRPEIGELAEPARAGTVGSITMPHKRNPESSEHLDTLARLVRAQAGVLVEGMAAQHERDGRGWKAEWVALPEACLLTATALRAAITLLRGLHVDTAAMARNLERADGYQRSEQALGQLAARVGGRRAQASLQEALTEAGRSGVSAAQALSRAGLGQAGGGQPGDGQPGDGAPGDGHPGDDRTGGGEPDRAGAGECGPMVDLVVERARAARAAEPAGWP